MTQKILEFLAERKQKWLDSKLKNETDEAKQQQIQQTATENFAPANWITDAAKRVSQLSMVSHPGKFSHPSAKISSFIAQADADQDGYLRSGNITYPLDVLGNAAAMDVFKFLSLPLSDEQTVLTHLEAETDLIRNFITAFQLDFEQIRQNFLGIKTNATNAKTDGLIKQVYFPVDDGVYHLLSVVTPSGIVTELKQRIDDMRFSDKSKQARECRKDKKWHAGFQDIPNLTVTAYGGTKPQNISVLNNQNAGRAYLLPCIPPQLTKQSIRLPSKDFFDQCLYSESESFKTPFKAIKKLININKNKKENKKGTQIIRQSMVNNLNWIIDEILWQAARIQKHSPGWSADPSFQRLPTEQQLWLDLDPNLQQQRQANLEWRDKIKGRIYGWIVGYLKKLGENIQIQDPDSMYLNKLIQEKLEQDKEFF